MRSLAGHDIRHRTPDWLALGDSRRRRPVRIDVHAHHYPPELLEALARAGGSAGAAGGAVNLAARLLTLAGRPLDDPKFEPFFAELNRRGAVLFLHPCGIGAPMTDAYGLDWMVGGCFEDTVTSLRLIMSGLTSRYPDVKIIIPHLGGTLP